MAPWSLLLAGLLALPTYEPARLESGAFELIMPPAAGGGEVRLELRVGTAGAVSEVETLLETPPYSEPLKAALRSWRFAPAREDDQAVESRVLVAALIRPPTLLLPGGAGEPPREAGRASAEVPMPTEAVTPPYPPGARGDGLVMVEVEISTEGRPTRTRVVRSAPGFDDAARSTALSWRFRPGRRGGRSVPAVAYLLFGFREPVTPPVPRR